MNKTFEQKKVELMNTAIAELELAFDAFNERKLPTTAFHLGRADVFNELLEQNYSDIPEQYTLEYQSYLDAMLKGEFTNE